MLLLHVIFDLVLVVFGLPETYEPTPKDVECLNDYDTEMTCHLSSEKLRNCSEYKLHVGKNYTCRFERANPSVCECKLKVPEGFVIGDDHNASFFREDKIVFSKVIITGTTIKPKRPTIVSVNLTANGNFLITWSTGYTNPTLNSYVNDLHTELIYGVKGSTANEKELVKEGRTQRELVGRNLQPNSNYYVKARVSTAYNDHSIFSDYSEEYEFNTSLSLQNIFKIIIPISCVIVIIFIATLYYCYSKIKSEWWNKIPAPALDLSLGGKIPQLEPFKEKFSPVYLESSKLDLAKMVYESVEEESVEDDTPSDLLDEYQSAGSPQMSQRNTPFKNLLSKNQDNQTECGTNPALSFSNRSYFASDSSDSCFGNNSIGHLDYHLDDSGNSLPAFSISPDPLIPTDFEYRPCNVCSDLANTSLKFTPSCDDAVVVPGYQSFGEVMGHNGHKEAVEA